MAAHAEGKIEGYLVRRCREAGGEAHKLTGRRGVPDRLAVIPRLSGGGASRLGLVYVEVKTPTGRLSPVQEHVIQELQEAGRAAVVVRSKEDVDELIRVMTLPLSRRPRYSTHTSMIRRCTNPHDPGYHSYGGRGIRVTPAWGDSPDGWLNYYWHIRGLPHAFEPGYSLDRIDNDGDYEPGNVRWATATRQRLNQRVRRPLVPAAPDVAPRHLARYYGVPAYTIRYRRQRYEGQCPLGGLAPAMTWEEALHD